MEKEPSGSRDNNLNTDNRDELNSHKSDTLKRPTVKKAKSKITLVAIILVALAAVVGIVIYALTNDGSRGDTEAENPAVTSMKKQLPELEKAIKNDPDNAELRHNLGSTYYAAGEIDKSIDEYKKALEIDNNRALTHNSLGNSYRDKQQFDAAIEEYKKAIKLDAKNESYYVNLASIQSQHKKNYKDAAETYGQAMNQFADNTNFMILRGSALEKAGDKPAAKAMYEQVLAKEPDNAAAKASLARVSK